MYYLLINGQRTGPYEAQDVQRMLRQGAIGYDTMFWKDGMMNWETVGAQRHQFETNAYQSPPQYQQQFYQQPPQVHVYQQPAPLLVQPVYAVSSKSRVAYILLGLFLGGLGVHNFYAGYSGKGFAQLLLTLLLFWTIIVPICVTIWIIIEVCTVDHDAYGNRMI